MYQKYKDENVQLISKLKEKEEIEKDLKRKILLQGQLIFNLRRENHNYKLAHDVLLRHIHELHNN